MYLCMPQPSLRLAYQASDNGIFTFKPTNDCILSSHCACLVPKGWIDGRDNMKGITRLFMPN